MDRLPNNMVMEVTSNHYCFFLLFLFLLFHHFLLLLPLFLPPFLFALLFLLFLNPLFLPRVLSFFLSRILLRPTFILLVTLLPLLFFFLALLFNSVNRFIFNFLPPFFSFFLVSFYLLLLLFIVHLFLLHLPFSDSVLFIFFLYYPVFPCSFTACSLRLSHFLFHASSTSSFFSNTFI
ncbi:hypothetical protein B7P43_G14618 [Cryptotermes secundus]|uniref:Uncharacterized protein n=1 Tax=Cryptotermes secundus TaxID=105785 RepID=A0A2J7RS98_9NEOP|nr:hypothetical protein B7P43_G14618 [Cryptotermes secundus]